MADGVECFSKVNVDNTSQKSSVHSISYLISEVDSRKFCRSVPQETKVGVDK